MARINNQVEMKRILITGKTGYIATKLRLFFDAWEEKNPGSYMVEQISVRDNNWEKFDFSRYHVLIHAAGIVHRKDEVNLEKVYYQINKDLTKKLAEKAKREGVNQFIFISTMSIYGMDTGKICTNTKPAPKSFYGKSKWEAECELQQMVCDEFKICIVRPAMVYGEGCKGNYCLLEKLACILPVFPLIENQRSMLHIDKLCYMIRIKIEENSQGVYLLQDDAYANTSRMVQKIAKEHGKYIWISKIFNPVVYLALICPVKKVRVAAQKAFGTLIYEREWNSKKSINKGEDKGNEGITN